ncbi:MAG: hypothetical protein IIZ56_01905 [Clostridia bacterium]|nr:hypothetical protein [Clostridia bacterium]
MCIFKKEAPSKCPKCGKADGWHVVSEDPNYNAVTSAASVNSFSSAPIRGTFGQNVTGTKGRSKKLLYRCDNCGCEKRY